MSIASVLLTCVTVVEAVAVEVVVVVLLHGFILTTIIINFTVNETGVYILSQNFKIAPKRAERALKIFIFAPILC